MASVKFRLCSKENKNCWLEDHEFESKRFLFFRQSGLCLFFTVAFFSHFILFRFSIILIVNKGWNYIANQIMVLALYSQSNRANISLRGDKRSCEEQQFDAILMFWIANSKIIAVIKFHYLDFIFNLSAIRILFDDSKYVI